MTCSQKQFFTSCKLQKNCLYDICNFILLIYFDVLIFRLFKKRKTYQNHTRIALSTPFEDKNTNTT